MQIKAGQEQKQRRQREAVEAEEDQTRAVLCKSLNERGRNAQQSQMT